MSWRHLKNSAARWHSGANKNGNVWYFVNRGSPIQGYKHVVFILPYTTEHHYQCWGIAISIMYIHVPQINSKWCQYKQGPDIYLVSFALRKHSYPRPQCTIQTKSYWISNNSQSAFFYMWMNSIQDQLRYPTTSLISYTRHTPYLYKNLSAVMSSEFGSTPHHLDLIVSQCGVEKLFC